MIGGRGPGADEPQRAVGHTGAADLFDEERGHAEERAVGGIAGGVRLEVGVGAQGGEPRSDPGPGEERPGRGRLSNQVVPLRRQSEQGLPVEAVEDGEWRGHPTGSRVALTHAAA